MNYIVMSPLVGRINHAGHDHPDTPYARKKCRAATVAEAERKAAATTRKPKARPDVVREEDPAPKVAKDVPTSVTPPIRKGRQQAPKRQSATVAVFTTGDLRALVDGLDQMQESLAEMVAQIEVASVTVRVGKARVRATLSDPGWTISVLNESRPEEA